MMHGFQQIVTEAECRDNFVVHGLPPLGDEMAVSPPNLEEEAHGFNKWQLGFQFLRNFYQLTAFEQAEMILYAALDPAVASRARQGDFVKCLDHFNLLQTARN
jgi:hypothetical protein